MSFDFVDVSQSTVIEFWDDFRMCFHTIMYHLNQTAENSAFFIFALFLFILFFLIFILFILHISVFFSGAGLMGMRVSSYKFHLLLFSRSSSTISWANNEFSIARPKKKTTCKLTTEMIHKKSTHCHLIEGREGPQLTASSYFPQSTKSSRPAAQQGNPKIGAQVTELFSPLLWILLIKYTIITWINIPCILLHVYHYCQL